MVQWRDLGKFCLTIKRQRIGRKKRVATEEVKKRRVKEDIDGVARLGHFVSRTRVPM